MKWTWETYDHFIIQHLAAMLCDEFLDSGELKTLQIDTCFSKLKLVRKQFKLASA